jgi:hypothetical protein
VIPTPVTCLSFGEDAGIWSKASGMLLAGVPLKLTKSLIAPIG